MSDEGDQQPGWSTGLTRSYSEHAALVLRHFEHHRRRTGESVRHTRSGPDFRYVNAIKSDDVQSEADDEDEANDPKNVAQKTWRISSSENQTSQQYNESTTLTDEFSGLSIDQQQKPCEIGAFSSSTSQNTTTTSSVEQRCQIFDDNYDYENIELVDDDDDEDCGEYEFPRRQQLTIGDNPNLIVTGSTTSLASSSSTANHYDHHQRLNGIPLMRKISYEDWSRVKQVELQRRKDQEKQAEQRRRELQELERREREEKEQKDYESFVEWLERKKRDKELKREMMEKEMELQKKIRDVEVKARQAKDICLRQWYKRKEDQQKAVEKRELMKKKKLEEDKLKRLQDSVKAYESWREKSKKTPRPATQGLLPHQKAKPAFTNPTPWQPLVDNASDDSDGGANQTKIFNPTSKIQRKRRVANYVKR